MRFTQQELRRRRNCSWCGVALVRAISALENLSGANQDESTGIKIVKRAIEEPLRQIVANAGGEGSVVVAKVARKRRFRL